MRESYASLVSRGCLCGTDRPAECPLHVGPSDLRGVAAYLKAGSPRGFPMTANCAVCGAASLMYPSVPLDRGEIPAGQAPPPTLVCPRCSRPAGEQALRAEAENFGYELNDRRVFGAVANVA
jgi:hypothetical protein